MPSLKTKVELSDGLNFLVPHTIVQDENGFLYLSDELNHVLLSLDSTGMLRWKIGGKGHTHSQFFYPRGISLGRLSVLGKIESCLAVCDSWNNRVQHFDLSGKYLSSWDSAGGREFREVCDVRYIMDAARENTGCWYLLDRGNHRLIALDNDGNILFELGKCFPPMLEARWLNEGFDPVYAPTMHRADYDFDSYDPLYYPAKILGHSETALYLFEPLSNQLKQPFIGSLFPLNIRPPDGCEWISANDDVFLAWDRKKQRLAWLGCSGDILCEASIEGTPVSSNTLRGEVWLYSPGRLELWRFALPPICAENRAFREGFNALADTAAHEAAIANPSGLFVNLLAGLPAYFRTCNQLLDQVRLGCRDAIALEPIYAKAVVSWRQLVEAGRPSSEQIQAFRLLSLKLSALARYFDSSQTLNALSTDLGRAADSLMVSIAEAVQQRDATFLLRHNLQYQNKADDLPAISTLADLARFQLEVIKEMLFFCGTQSRRLNMQFLSPGSVNKYPNDETSISWIAPRRHRHVPPASRCLHELTRFRIIPPDAEYLPHPHCVVQTSEGDYFVTLFSPGTLAHLDADGRWVEELFAAHSECEPLAKPTGLALDAYGRLWIVEQLAKRIRIYNPRDRSSEKKVVFPDTGNLLNSPAGIGRGPNGAMLVADVGSQRLISVQDTGPAGIFCDRVGTGPGEFRCPTCIFPSIVDEDPCYWVVDQRNHRLQKLDQFSNFIQQIGKCGFGKGSFLAPWFAGQFKDRVLAISQGEVEPCLKLFSPEGEELDCMFLDYWPSGIFVSDDKLIVADWEGDSIRIYKRTS